MSSNRIDDLVKLFPADIANEVIDYSQLELYVLAAMMHESKDGIVLDLEGSGSIAGLSEHPPCEFLYKTIQTKERATKQNGRSATYLQHDPTKHHKGPRKS